RPGPAAGRDRDPDAGKKGAKAGVRRGRHPALLEGAGPGGSGAHGALRRPGPPPSDGDPPSHASAVFPAPGGLLRADFRADRGRDPRHPLRLSVLTEVRMPKLGMAMKKGTLKRWLVAEGGVVEQGKPLLEDD